MSVVVCLIQSPLSSFTFHNRNIIIGQILVVGNQINFLQFKILCATFLPDVIGKVFFFFSLLLLIESNIFEKLRVIVPNSKLGQCFNSTY